MRVLCDHWLTLGIRNRVDEGLELLLKGDAIVVVLLEGDFLHEVYLGRRGRRGPGTASSREAGTPEDEKSQFRDADPLGGITLKDASQNLVQLRRERQNRT